MTKNTSSPTAVTAEEHKHKQRRRRSKESKLPPRGPVFWLTLAVAGGSLGVTYLLKNPYIGFAAAVLLVAVLVFNERVGFRKKNWSFVSEGRRGHDSNRHFTLGAVITLYLLLLANIGVAIYVWFV